MVSEVISAVLDKPDLDSKKQIKAFIELFYQQILKDDLLAHIFLEVAEIDIPEHLGIIRRYWEKLLLGENDYTRHTMNIHRTLHAKYPLSDIEFDRWLALFTATLEDNFVGEKTERAKKLAQNIAANMENTLLHR